MAEYLPIHKPGAAITLKASATTTGGQLVVVTGSGTVGPAGADSQKVVGVAANDAATDEYVTIYAGGVQHVVASGSITAGDLVVSAATGKVKAAAAVTTPTPGDVNTSRAVVGLALTTAADGAACRIQFVR